MRVIGLDWAVDCRDRAAVVLDRVGDGIIKVAEVITPVNDEEAKRQCTCGTNDVVAVDIPFAWPKPFTEFVSKWTAHDAAVIQPPESIKFRYRTTDRFVHKQTKKWPLSISSNLFALGARQWAEVVSRAKLAPQIVLTKGSPAKTKPSIIEVYPAATLKVLEGQAELSISGRSTRILEAGGHAQEKKFSYKTDERTRRALVESLIAVFQLEADEATRKALVSRGKKDHAADALLAALTALMFVGALRDWTVRYPDDSQSADAICEGWIFFPECSPRADES